MRKIQYLDGLRGLAAFVVVFHHFVYAFYPALFLGAKAQPNLKIGNEAFASGSIWNLLYNGNFAVCVFFVLSGFVLSHKFFLQKKQKIILESAVKRYFRLVIPVLFSVLLAFILMKFSLFYNKQAAEISGSNWLGLFWTFSPSFAGALEQSFVGAFFSNVFEYNMTLWSIAYEFLGSFLVFGFLALFGKRKYRGVAYLGAIIIFFQTYYLAFILGMLLSDLAAHKKMFLEKLDKSKLLRTALLLGGLFLGSYPSGRGVEGTIYAAMEKTYLVNSAVLYHIVGAFLVIMVLLESKRMQKIFSFKYLLFLGEISFAMYLLHFIVLGSFSSFIFTGLVAHMSYAEAFLLVFVLSVGLIFLLAYVMSVHIDKKAVNFSRLVYEYLAKKMLK